ncbi:MAG: hypothetical protein LIP77_05605 [Planctomycetes bacterium]|nr:hypothetical protein [Planctomycetota bacterium]
MDALTTAVAVEGGGGSGYWQLAMILAAVGFLGVFHRWRKRRTPALPRARELRERDQEPNRYRDAADKAIVEILETSRSLNAQVDAKIRVLNRLVKEAEDNIARLEAVLARANPPADAPPAATSDRAADSPEPAAGRERVFLSELHERIHRLSQEGKTDAEIARATSLSTTEVAFALAAMAAEE